jgi:hypothetical protein|tara:strand:- start:1696 stop:1953 length:258 start_codon:yes stop_codon:yes gene_type:complete
MFFGTTTFAQTTFSDIGSSTVSPVVIVSGNRFNITIGNIGPIPNQLIVPTGIQLNVATNPVSAITWNPIPPGVNQVWVPIDPLNP